MVDDLLDLAGMSQVEFAAAANVTQSAVSQWANGKRSVPSAVRHVLDRLLAARDASSVRLDVGLRRGPVVIPERLWEPVFRPRGRFRLPLHLEWSGTDSQRWRDADDPFDVLDACVQVMSEGAAADIIAWVDPVVVAEHMDEILWPRGYRAPWRDALTRWGLL